MASVKNQGNMATKEDLEVFTKQMQNCLVKSLQGNDREFSAKLETIQQRIEKMSSRSDFSTHVAQLVEELENQVGGITGQLNTGTLLQKMTELQKPQNKVANTLKQAVSDAAISNDLKFKAALRDVSMEMQTALENNQRSVADQTLHARGVLSSALEINGKALGTELQKALNKTLATCSITSSKDKGTKKYLDICPLFP